MLYEVNNFLLLCFGSLMEKKLLLLKIRSQHEYCHVQALISKLKSSERIRIWIDWVGLELGSDNSNMNLK